jgi:ABC-2 type transport system permease protein
VTGLVRVEGRRYRYRAAVRWLAVVAVVAGLAVALLAWGATRPPSAQTVTAAEEQFAQAQADWAENGEQYVEDCLAGEAQERETTPDADWGCDDIEPRAEWYLLPQPTFAETAGSWVSGVTVLLLLLAFAAGITFVTAEWGSGALGMWLTFVPRRGRVYASKVLVAALGVLPVTAVALALTVGGSWAAATVNDAVGDVSADVWQDLGEQALRVLAAAAVVGALGAALGFLTRSAAGALGIGVGWLLVVDSAVSGFLPRLTGWTLRSGLQAWVDGGLVYFVDVPCPPGDGEASLVCTAGRTLSAWQGGAVVAGVAALVVVVGGLVFRRRDVD